MFAGILLIVNDYSMVAMVFKVVASVVYGISGYCYGAGKWLLWYFVVFQVVGSVTRWLL